MTLDGSHRTKRAASLPILGVVTGAVLLGLMSSTATADPAEDAVAKLNDLSRQAEQAAEAMHSAQLDLNQKLDVQAAADRRIDLDRMADTGPAGRERRRRRDVWRGVGGGVAAAAPATAAAVVVAAAAPDAARPSR